MMDTAWLEEYGMGCPQSGYSVGILKHRESLLPLTTWKIGGVAKRIYFPSHLSDLIAFVKKEVLSEPILFLGAGSNVLVQEEGFDGTVVVTHRLLNHIQWNADDSVWVQAGVSLTALVCQCALRGLVGLESLAGIPGTVGGALVMNAGAYGTQTWDFVSRVLVMDRLGVWKIREAKEYNVGYRSVPLFPGEWFLAAQFQLTRGDSNQSLKTIRQTLARRRQAHPLEWPNAGSVFRNPPGDFAARLIEASHLKGYQIGGARVSPKHANFIINERRATADDVWQLIRHVQKTVERDHSIRLCREVRILSREGMLADEV